MLNLIDLILYFLDKNTFLLFSLNENTTYDHEFEIKRQKKNSINAFRSTKPKVKLSFLRMTKFSD